MFSEREREREREHIYREYSIQFVVTKILFGLSPVCLHSNAVLSKTEAKSLCKKMNIKRMRRINYSNIFVLVVVLFV